MDKEDIQLTDIGRIIFGDAPPAFTIEVIIRTIIVYVVLIVVMRFLGKRMSGQLSNAEMAVMLMLGAIVSAAMQMPETGILEGVFVLVLVLAFQRLYTLWLIKNHKLEELAGGRVSVLVIDGILQLEELEKVRVSKDQLFASLRTEAISQLGEVKRVYMEMNGGLSIYKFDTPRAGLSILPEEDLELLQTLGSSSQQQACINCGTVRSVSDQTSCNTCAHDSWAPVIQ